MAIRVDSASFSGTGICVGGTGLGVTGAVIRATTGTGTHGEGLLYDDWDDASDDAKELRAFITSWPSGATLFVGEAGDFALSGADGSYTIGYRLDEDGASQGTTSETVNIGTLSVLADFSATYTVVGSAQQDLAGTYTVIGSAQQDLAGTYAVIGSAQQDLAGTYAVVGSAQQDLAASYALIGAVQRDLEALYDIEAAAPGTVSADLSALYSIIAAVERDFAAAYGVTEAVETDLPGSYDVLGSAHAELAASWTISNSVQADFTATWAAAGSVSQDLSAAYQVFASTGAGASVEEIWAYTLPNGMSAQDTLTALHAMVLDLYRIHGLLPGTPLVVSPTARQAGPVEQTVSKAGDTVTVERV